MTLRCFAVSSPHGLSAGIFCSSQTDSSSRWKYCACPPAHGWMAPCSIVSAGLATTSSGSTSKRVPSPSQCSQAPYGELNEKLRGASSS